MEGKLFVFGIGGTGSRVLRSLTMLASAGVDVEATEIVPIIIDPDFANADLTRTVTLFTTYSKIREKLNFDSSTQNKFFKMKIEDYVNGYILRLNDTKNRKFKDFIAFSSLSKENMAMNSMLFSKENLNSDMEVGFKGNPNIGSVVLNQFTQSKEFVSFANSFKPGDRIFIVSSIFGGTGASGFPLLLKNLRSLNKSIANCAAISDAPIGAITVLPYFTVTQDSQSSIDSSTFIGKAKAALHYYENNVTGEESSVNVMYYIGDSRNRQYDNVDGGARQRNNAHIVELAAALAISDFAAIRSDDPCMTPQKNQDGRVFIHDAEFKEFGIKKDAQSVLFSDLCSKTKDLLNKPLTQFLLFSRYLKEHIEKAKGLPWMRDNQFDDAFIKSSFMDDVKSISLKYLEWIKELRGNDRAFAPFNDEIDERRILEIVRGVQPSKIHSLTAFGKKGYDLIDAYLDAERRNMSNNFTKEQKFIELFYLVTEKIAKFKYKF